MIEKIRPLFDLDTSLRDVPRVWINYIEPKINRPKGSMCWLWTGGVDDRGEPVMSVTKVGSKFRTNTRVKRMVASIFWNIKRHYDIIHECGEPRCLNPWHFYISVTHASHENREKMVKAKRKNLHDYMVRNGLDADREED